MQYKMIDLSIVIPVYNVKEYLEESVQSVVEAAIEHSEIILVDDGSTDGSQDLCDKLHNKNPDYIRVVHQENGGLSDARNKGLLESRGKYIFFMDSDDTIVPEQFRELVDVTKKMDADITIGRAKYIFQDGREVEKATYCVADGFMNGRSYLEYILKNSRNNSFCAQFNLYKSQFLRQNNLTFYKGIIHEDELWTPTVFLAAKKVFVTSIYFYRHYQRVGSIMTGSKATIKARSLYLICKELEDLYSRYPKSEVRYLKNRMAMLFLKAYGLDPEHSDIVKGKRFMPICNACKKRTLQLAILYTVSPKLYCKMKEILHR